MGAIIIALIGAIIANNWLILAVGYLLLVIPAIVFGNVLRAHIKFLIGIVIPVAGLNLFVWSILIGAPPSQVAGSNPEAGLKFAAVTALRLTFIGGIIQAYIISIPTKDFPSTLRRWGLQNEWLIAALCARVLGPEMIKQINRAYIAALARGLLPNRSIWNRMKLLPVVLIPLVIWSLRSAIHRADNWHERKLLEKINKVTYKPDDGSFLISFIIIISSVFWLILTCSMRWI